MTTRLKKGKGKKLVEKLSFTEPPMRFSLRYKLALPVLVLIILLILLISGTTFTVVRDIVVDHYEDRLQTIANIFTETLKVPLRLKTEQALYEHIQWMTTQPDVVEVRVEDSAQANVASVTSKKIEFPEILQHPDSYGVYKINPSTYAVANPIKIGESETGRLILVFSGLNVESKLIKIFKERLLIGLLITILIALSILGITWVAIKPLFVLQRTANNILKGDLKARAHIHSRDEIEDVANAFNEVLNRLIRSFDNLRLRSQALEESEERYRMVVDNSSDIIFSLSETGDFLVLNRSFSGYSREKILAGGLPLLLAMHAPHEAEKFQKALETICTTKKPIAHLATTHLHFVHGSEIHYLTNLTPVTDYEGNIKVIQGVMRDVTELRRIEIMKENLIRDVAHELKTPTAKFQMTVSWLEREMKKPNTNENNKYLPLLKIMKENSERLMRTIMSIMDLSRIGSGMSQAKKELLDLNDVIRQAVEDVRPLCEKKGLKLLWESNPVPLPVQGDADMLYRVFVNLMVNGMKFTQEGHIEVKASRRGAEAYVQVRDTGMGIEPEFFEKIFDPFFQKTASTMGIGVGLTISKEIISLHDGEIWAESEGPGKGSTFKVVLPLMEGQKSASPPVS